MKRLVEDLCAPECAGRGPGTPGGIRARGLVRDALRRAGVDPVEQPIAVKGAANLVATIPGDVDRWVLVGAHVDHLGGTAKLFYPGADDNAAAVAILVEIARSLARTRPAGRGVVLAVFDAEEQPHFLNGSMGSAYYAKHAAAIGPAIEKIDFMLCMDLVGHSLGPEGIPDSVRSTLFALGAERSAGTSAIVEELAISEPGLVVRPADAEIIPPLSDYDAFWRRNIPFLFLTSGRSAQYHTPEDTPDRLDWAKMARTARWLERFVRRTCARSEDRIVWCPDGRDDRMTLRSFRDLVAPLALVSPLAAGALARAKELLDACDAKGRLPAGLAEAPGELVLGLERALA